MNIQIFGKSKCFDTKKAERYFKERRIPFQSIDLKTYGMSGREFDSVLRAVGGIDNLIDWDGRSPDITLMKYMDDQRAKEDKVFDNPALANRPRLAIARKSGRRGNNIIDHESGSLKMESRFFIIFPIFLLQFQQKSGMLGGQNDQIH